MNTTGITTQVGTTANLLDSSTVTASVSEALGAYVDDYDVSAITEDYRAEINRVAPSGLVLAGDVIFADLGRLIVPLDLAMDSWHDVIGRIDFWSIVAKHDITEDV
ncbi:MAG: hypothetical protein WCS71_05315 [Sphaerochaetaceae bacterium]